MIIVMGLPGAGKSSVLAGAEGTGYAFLNYGTLMFEIAKEEFGLGHRDEMRKLPVAKQKKVQEAVANRLSREKGKVILDTHCSIRTPRGYLPGLPFSLLEKLHVDSLVLITATPEEIMGRRNSDGTRVRDPEPIESVREHDMINKALLAAYAAHRGCPARIIYNHDGKLEDAVRQLRELLE
ncbi:MAG: adenylate kinase [Candidatus Micrarchaeia archaeon]|jgi:adenylate kinase